MPLKPGGKSFDLPPLGGAWAWALLAIRAHESARVARIMPSADRDLRPQA